MVRTASGDARHNDGASSTEKKLEGREVKGLGCRPTSNSVDLVEEKK